MLFNFALILFSILFVSTTKSYAQVCGPTFEAIDINCILKYDQKLKAEVSKEERRSKVLEREEENPKSTLLKKAQLQNNLVFYFESSEAIKGLLNTVYFYQTSANHYGKMLIKNISGVDRGSFDESGGSDFILQREHGICVFKKINGNIVKAFKLKAVEEADGNIILMYASLFLFGLAVFLVARTVFQDEDRFKAQEKLEDAEQDEKQQVPNDIVLKYSRPFFKRYFTPVINGMKNKRKIREKYKRPLASSGMNKFLTPEDFFAFKLFLIIGFPIVYLGLRSFLEEDWPLMYTPLISIFGFFYPDLWIKGKIDQRRQNVIENMPFVVDMLALSVEAGLDFVAAMQKVIEKAPKSALVEEFETLIKETKVGASRAEALRQLSWRIDALPVSSFCATLISADSVGANIGPILKTLAAELRERRSAMIEKKGAQAATKILIPMIFLVLPAVLIVIAAPIALQLMEGS